MSYNYRALKIRIQNRDQIKVIILTLWIILFTKHIFQYRKKTEIYTSNYIMPRQVTHELHVIILHKIWTTRYQLHAITQKNIGTKKDQLQAGIQHNIGTQKSQLHTIIQHNIGTRIRQVRRKIYIMS